MAEKIRVLYVDDEPGLLDLGKLYLEQSGDFTVTTSLSANGWRRKPKKHMKNWQPLTNR